MATSATALLQQLESLKTEFGSDPARRKLELLGRLERTAFPRAGDLLRLHELLCFQRAYPDSPALLEQVEGMLSRFDRRKDLRRHRDELADTGIAGTAIHYRFYEPTMVWLRRRWGDLLTIDWSEFEKQDLLYERIDLLALYCESPGLDEHYESTRDWVDRLRGPEETDAAFLIRRFEALKMDEFTRQRFFEELDVPMTLAPGPDTPARTRAKTRHTGRKIHFQDGPMARGRPDLEAVLSERPRSVRSLSPAQGRELIDLAREAMVTRARDLDLFMHGDPQDVRLVDWGDGLQFAVIGARPPRRLMFEAVYAFLTLKNGVPIGYVLNSALFGSAEIAYNVFETYRGAEAGPIYGRVLATVRTIFGTDAFTIYPYQLGHENQEGLESGAWWFYQKMGFRAREDAVLRLMNRELARMQRDPRQRSSLATLRKLAAHNVYYFMGRPREDVIGLLPFGDLGLRITAYVADRFGSDREGATRTCAREAALRFGVRSTKTWSPGERLAWDRWGPLLTMLKGVERWTPKQKRDAVLAVRAKGGRRESDFVLRFDAHRRLRQAVSKLARG